MCFPLSLFISLSPTQNTRSRLLEMEEGKTITANRLLAVKRKSGKSYSQIAEETGLTNVYVAQLLRRQAQLKPDTALVLRAALPDLTDDLLQEMMRPPMRSYDPSLIQEPTIYRYFALPIYPSSSLFLNASKVLSFIGFLLFVSISDFVG